MFIPNKFNHGSFQKTDAGSKSQGICQELTVTTGHTQASSSEILRILQNTMIVGWYMLIALQRQNDHHTVVSLRKFQKWIIQNRLKLVQTHVQYIDY